MKIQTFRLGELNVNCYIVYENHKAFIVDPGYESQAILDFITNHQLDVSFIYITHGHPDHIGGIDFINQHLNVDVYAPIKDQWWIETYAKANGITATITKWIKEPFVIDFNGSQWHVYDTPGHSEGGTVLYHEPSHTVFAGDTLFYQTVGRTDIPYANKDVLVHSIRKMYQLFSDEVIVYPGHGRTTSIGHEKQFNPFVRKSTI